MVTTETIAMGDGGNTYNFSFAYLKTEDVKVELQEYDATQPAGNQIISRQAITAFTVPPAQPTQVVFNAIGADTVYQTAPDGDVRVTSTNGYSVRVRIYRFTEADATPATFISGSSIRAKDLNDNFEQILYIMQERQNTLQTIQTGGIGENIISTAALQDDAVTADKLSDSTVTDSLRAVTTDHIRNDAVTADKLADTAVTPGTYTAVDLTVDAQGRITAAASGTIATSEIESNAVTTGKLDAAAVTTAKIADLNVTTAKLADTAVTTAKITDLNVTTGKLADNAVTTAKITDLNVTTGKLANDAVTAAKLADTTVSAGSYTYAGITVDAQGRLTAASNGNAPLFESYALLSHTEASGTNGGSTTAGSWETRPINTVDTSASWASLSSNQFTLDAGTYLIKWFSSAYDSNFHQARLQNISDGSTVKAGVITRGTGGNQGYGISPGAAKITIASSKIFEIQSRVSTSKIDEGFGLAQSWGDEVYATVEIYKQF